MSKSKQNPSHPLQHNNLVGKEDHREFLSIQSEYGFAQRGGSLPWTFRPGAKRLVSNINLLTYQERKQLVYSELISKN